MDKKTNKLWWGDCKIKELEAFVAEVSRGGPGVAEGVARGLQKARAWIGDLWFLGSACTLCARGDDEATLAKLLDLGAPIDEAEHAESSTALGAASRTGSARCVELLLRRGADVDKPSTYAELTPLMNAAIAAAWQVEDEEQEARRQRALECARILLRAGADLSLRDWQGETAMAMAERLAEGRSCGFEELVDEERERRARALAEDIGRHAPEPLGAPRKREARAI